MKLRSAHKSFLILGISVAVMISCSKHSPTTQDNLTRHFNIKGKRYILNAHEPGVIYDDAVRYTADAGARTFYYADKQLLRHLFVGRREDFGSLTPLEKQETLDIANAALELIQSTGSKDYHLSSVDQQHRRILAAFVAGTR